MSKASAKMLEKAKYGDNTMHPFDTESEYDKRVKELKSKGEKFV